MPIFTFENGIENYRNKMHSLVLDTFCICKSEALQIQNTQNEEGGIMNLKEKK